MELGDWAGAERFGREALAAAVAMHSYVGDLDARIWIRPRLAVAVARQGRAAEAAALIADAPADCYHCLVTRGQVAALGRDRAGAARWFAEAVRLGPRLPQARLEWARMLAAAGDPDGALAQLKVARERAPRFADVRELAGEARLAKQDAAGAIAEFRAADAISPRWGRNHLVWGVALARQGKTDEARNQWLAARGLDLSATDRARVDGLLAG